MENSKLTFRVLSSSSKQLCFTYSLNGFNGAKTNCKIAHSLDILLMNNNCFDIYFQKYFSYVCSVIYYKNYSSSKYFFVSFCGLKRVCWQKSSQNWSDESGFSFIRRALAVLFFITTVVIMLTNSYSRRSVNKVNHCHPISVPQILGSVFLSSCSLL